MRYKLGCTCPSCRAYLMRLHDAERQIFRPRFENMIAMDWSLDYFTKALNRLEEKKMTDTPKLTPTPEPITNPAIKVLVERQALVARNVNYYNGRVIELEQQAEGNRVANKPWKAEQKAIAVALKKLGHKG